MFTELLERVVDNCKVDIMDEMKQECVELLLMLTIWNIIWTYFQILVFSCILIVKNEGGNTS